MGTLDLLDFLFKNGEPLVLTPVESTGWNEVLEECDCCDFEEDLIPYKIILKDPATIVLWNDGTKTVVKAQNGEKFDKEKGIALCYMKKVLGNTGRYNEIFKQFIKEDEK